MADENEDAYVPFVIGVLVGALFMFMLLHVTNATPAHVAEKACQQLGYFSGSYSVSTGRVSCAGINTPKFELAPRPTKGE